MYTAMVIKLNSVDEFIESEIVHVSGLAETEHDACMEIIEQLATYDMPFTFTNKKMVTGINQEAQRIMNFTQRTKDVMMTIDQLIEDVTALAEYDELDDIEEKNMAFTCKLLVHKRKRTNVVGVEEMLTGKIYPDHKKRKAM
jgi:hypothetical protein